MRIRPVVLLLVVAASVLFTAPVFADACPYCGKQYGSGPSSASVYLDTIRSNHEAACRARYRKLQEELSRVRQKQRQSAEKLRQAERTRRAAAEQSKGPKSSQTLVDAINRLRLQYLKAVKKNERLEAEVRGLEHDFRVLQSKLLKVRERNEDLLCVIAGAEETEWTLQREQSKVNRQWQGTRQRLAVVEKVANERAELLRQARSAAARTAVEDYGQSLGSPRDFMEFTLGEAETDRRVVKIYERPRPDIQEYEVASGTPEFGDVVAGGSGVRPVPPELARMPLGDLRSKLSRELDEYSELAAETARLRRQLGDAQKELDRAVDRADERRVRHQRLRGTIDELKNEIAWKRWDIEVWTDQIGDSMWKMAQDALETARWKVFNHLLKVSLQDEAAKRSAVSLIKMAAKLIKEDLPQVPYAAAYSSGQAAVRDFENLPATQAEEFYDDAFDLNFDPPMYESKLRKLLEACFGE